MIGIVATVIGTGLALWITSLIYKDISFGAKPEIATVIIVAAILGLVNSYLKPLIKMLSLPLTLLTFGLFGFIVNGLLLLALAWVRPRARARSSRSAGSRPSSASTHSSRRSWAGSS